MDKKRIVITGMGVVSCFGNDVDHFYEQLLAGKSGVGPIHNFPCEEYPTRFAASIPDFDTGDYIDKKQARRVDGYTRYALVAGKKALEHAGLLHGEAFDRLNKMRSGILMGSGMGGMNVFYEGVETMLHKGFKRMTPFFVPYIITNMAGGLLAIDLGFMGPTYSISTACATGNFCITAAANHIRMGHADLMVCGGSESAVVPVGLAGFVACRALSTRNEAPTKASRPWDKGRDGFVIGEGSGALVLESLDHALARGAPIIAEYLGGAFSCDAYHITDPRADGLGVTICLKNALQDAGIAKEQVDYINAHATSTIAGDLAEVRSVQHVFGSHTKKLKMNSTKSMTGHCLGAAAAIEAIVSIKALTTGVLHPTINLDDPEPELGDLDLIPHVAKKHEVNIAVSNSFGFGGHNSAIVLSRYIVN